MSSVIDENTPFLGSETALENEVVSYVQRRRASIQSVGAENIPRNTIYRTTSQERIPSLRSYPSLENVASLLSHHTMLKEPETNIGLEIKVILKYSIPLIITFLLQYSLTVASVFSVGRLGSDELAAVSLSSMTANISGYAIIQGISTCLDTLCAQAYGRKDYNAVGLHFMRCNYFIFILYIPIFVFWYFLSESILLMLVDQENLCVLASKYLQILGFGLPGFILFENGKHYLQSQGVFHASTYVLAFCAPLNALLNYVLVWDKTIGMGFVGAPLSVVFTNWLMCVLLYLYIYFVRGYECWPKDPIFSRTMFKNWKRMINLSIPGVLMVEAEWLAFEIITFTASKFGTDVLAAQSIVSTTCVLLYQIPFALSIASSTRIAWYIGAASKKAAKLATTATLYTAFSFGVINGLFLFFFRNSLASLYTRDKNVIALASRVLIIGALYQVNDSLTCATGGVLRGQGRQKIGGILNLVSYYLIALPCAFLLAFHYKLELFGLWLGMLIALFVISILQYLYVKTSDWNSIIDVCINEAIIEDSTRDTLSLIPTLSNSRVM